MGWGYTLTVTVRVGRVSFMVSVRDSVLEQLK